jgi:histidinol-phosphate aminotransferase
MAYKLSSNESPYPPLPGVLAAVSDAAASLNRYPDMMSADLVELLARFHGVDADQVVVGNGSLGVLGHLLSAFAGEGDQVLFPWRSFEAYPIVAGVAGAEAVTAPLGPGGQVDLGALAAAVTPATRVVMVCTPNNPTGPAVSEAGFRQFMAKMPDDVLVVADEAYAEFVTDPAAVRCDTLLEEYPNLVELRTFSKAYGLAGLRVGYGLGRPRIVKAIRLATTPFSVSAMAQMAAALSIQMQDEMRQRVEQIVAVRDSLRDELLGQGWDVPQAQGNFVWLDLGVDAAPFARACAQAGVVVRAFDGEGVRITAAEPEAAAVAARVAASWL